MASQDLTQGNIPSQLVRMTIPMFLGISSMIVAGMIETVYIGILGADQLAAYSFTFPLIMALSSVSMGIGTGAASVIARAQGQGDRRRVQVLTTHAMLLTLVLVVLLVMLGEWGQHRLFAAMGAEGRIQDLISSYMRIWILGLALFTLPMVTNTVLRAVGNAKVPGYVMTTTSGLQVILSPIVIFGLLGMPALGFIGSAWASIATGLVRTFGMLWVLVRQERLIIVGKGSLDGLGESARTILYIGFPSMLNSLIGPVSMATTIWLLSQHGAQVVAAFGITSRFEMLVTMVLMSLSGSIGPFVGQNWGARKIDRIYSALSTAYRFCIVWGLACFALLGPFGDNLVALVNDEPALVEAAGWYLLLVPVSFGLLGIGMISGSTFVALGHPVPTTVLALLRMVVIYIPVAFLLNHFFGYIGIFCATLIANLVMGCMAFLWSRRLLRQEIARIDMI